MRSVGEDVALTCTVENPSGYTVSWVKQNKENTGQPFALSYNTLLTVKDSRFNLTATPDSYTFHVSFSLFFVLFVKKHELSREILFQISIRFVILNMMMQHNIRAQF